MTLVASLMQQVFHCHPVLKTHHTISTKILLVVENVKRPCNIISLSSILQSYMVEVSQVIYTRTMTFAPTKYKSFPSTAYTFHASFIEIFSKFLVRNITTIERFVSHLFPILLK